MATSALPVRPLGPTPMGGARPLADLIHEARQLERDGCLPEAMERYERAIASGTRAGERGVVAEAMRRLAVLKHQRGDSQEARELCEASCAAARDVGNDVLAAEALNVLGGLCLATGMLGEARIHFVRALEIGSGSQELGARVEQNLGILANIQGEWNESLERYKRSLDAYVACGNEHGCAIAYHNLGLVSVDRELWDEAETYFGRSREIAERAGDVYLRAACFVGNAKVQLIRQRFEDARQSAEAALSLFDQLGAKAEKSGAYRLIGVVYRDTGKPALAESRLRSAIELASSTNSVLNEADATSELALLYQAMGRNQEALALLNRSHALYGRLDARRDLINVSGKVVALEGTYLAVVREWGQSIGSSDSYTYGHCERVADNAVAVARALGLDEQQQTTIRLGAYLHDVGKVKVPHEILNKPGPLTRDEFEVIQMHPVWGIELLDEIEFPWDIKPIIRWHHEKYDGTGYPDRLRGDEIPLAAQLVGIVDVYDALTTTRAYRGAMTHEKAMEVIEKCRASWSPEVYAAFAGLERPSGSGEAVAGARGASQ
jgi:putative nucleotidyltransferase with HDIG domain